MSVANPSAARTESPNAVTIPKREGRPVFYDAIKAPQIRDLKGKTTCFLIAVKSGAEHAIPTSPELYARVNGRELRKKPHSGYDNLREHAFVIWDKDGVAFSVDRINVMIQEYPEKTFSDAQEAQRTIDFEYQPDGSLYIKSTPIGVSRPHLFELVKLINAAGVIAPDQELSKMFEIAEITGNKVKVNVTNG